MCILDVSFEVEKAKKKKKKYSDTVVLKLFTEALRATTANSDTHKMNY